MEDPKFKKKNKQPRLQTDKGHASLQSEALPERPPRSVSSFTISLIGLACLMMTFYAVRQEGWYFQWEYGKHVTHLLLLASLALPILLLDALFLRTWRKSSAGLTYDGGVRGILKRVNLRRSFSKYIGLCATLGGISFFYWLFPFYDKRDYIHFFELCMEGLPYFLCLASPYILFVDALMKNPKDGLFQAGCVVTFRWKHLEKEALKQYVLGWLIKGFFLPLMFVAFTDNVHYFMTFQMESRFQQYLGLYFSAISLMYFIDVAYAVIGYMCTFRLTDTHIRLSEPSMLGWVVTLMCYPPFNSMFTHYLHYEGKGGEWHHWLSAHPTLLVLWGSAIVGCVAFYAMATAIFGCRFSNMTHRGIITNGPYRLTKHPAYVSKNISWWLISIPFVPMWQDNWIACIGFSMMLLGVNGFYFFRARCEERMLSTDPDYVAYALWMNKNSMFSFMGKVLPFLRYKPPADPSVPVSHRPLF